MSLIGSIPPFVWLRFVSFRTLESWASLLGDYEILDKEAYITNMLGFISIARSLHKYFSLDP